MPTTPYSLTPDFVRRDIVRLTGLVVESVIAT
jgi:hypothetical protein